MENIVMSKDFESGIGYGEYRVPTKQPPQDISLDINEDIKVSGMSAIELLEWYKNN